MFRMPQAFLPPQFRAEEFSIFYLEDRRLGMDALFKTYAGYLHLFPRLIAFVLRWVPFEWAPFTYKLVSVLTAQLVGVMVAVVRLPISKPMRVFMILLVGLVPGSGEVFLNTANAITLVGAIGILLYIQAPATRIELKLFESLVLFVTGLSGAFMIFLFPIVGVRLFLTDWPKRIYYRIGVLVLVTLTNMIFYSAGGRLEGTVASRELEAWLECFVNFNNSFLFGRLPIHGTGAHLIGYSVMVGAALVMRNAIKNLGFWSSLRSESAFYVACGAAVWLASIYLFRNTPHLIAPYDGGGRYFYLPYLLLAFGFLSAYPRAGRARTFVRGLVAVSTVASFLSFRPIPVVIQYRDYHFLQQVAEIRSKQKNTLMVPPNWDIDVRDVEFP